MKKDSKTVKVFRVVYALNFIAQAAFSMVCPAGVIIFAGWFLRNRCGVGQWVMIAAIVVGVLVGVYSMFYYIFKMSYAVDPTQSNEKGGDRDEGLYGNAGKRRERNDAGKGPENGKDP